MVDVREEETVGRAFDIIFDLLLKNKHTFLPGIIQSFNSVERTCSVQPSIQRLYEGDEETTILPTVKDAPVVYPGSNNFYLEVELKEGDEVACAVSERSLDVWMEQGGVVDPEDYRTLDLSDLIVLGGMKTKANPQGPVGSGIALRNAEGTAVVRVEDDVITATVGTTQTEITVEKVKVKPGIPLTSTDLEAYQGIPVALIQPPGGIAPVGYVSMINHIHQDGTGIPTTMPIPIPGPP